MKKQINILLILIGVIFLGIFITSIIKANNPLLLSLNKLIIGIALVFVIYYLVYYSVRYIRNRGRISLFRFSISTESLTIDKILIWFLLMVDVVSSFKLLFKTNDPFEYYLMQVKPVIFYPLNILYLLFSLVVIYKYATKSAKRYIYLGIYIAINIIHLFGVLVWEIRNQSIYKQYSALLQKPDAPFTTIAITTSILVIAILSLLSYLIYRDKNKLDIQNNNNLAKQFNNIKIFALIVMTLYLVLGLISFHNKQRAQDAYFGNFINEAAKDDTEREILKAFVEVQMGNNTPIVQCVRDATDKGFLTFESFKTKENMKSIINDAKCISENASHLPELTVKQTQQFKIDYIAQYPEKKEYIENLVSGSEQMLGVPSVYSSFEAYAQALGNYYSASLPLYQFLEDNFRSYSIILDENDEMAISFTTDQLYDEYSKLVDDVLSAQDTSNSALNKFQAEKSKVLKQRGISSSSQEKLYQSLMNQ